MYVTAVCALFACCCSSRAERSNVNYKFSSDLRPICRNCLLRLLDVRLQGKQLVFQAKVAILSWGSSGRTPQKKKRGSSGRFRWAAKEKQSEGAFFFPFESTRPRRTIGRAVFKSKTKSEIKSEVWTVTSAWTGHKIVLHDMCSIASSSNSCKQAP
jgi:hypothetical protein